MTVVDLEAARRARAARAPASIDTRPPDFTMSGWINGNDVEWVELTGVLHDPTTSQAEKLDTLLKAVWVFSEDPSVPWEKKYAAMIVLGVNGACWRRYNRTLTGGSKKAWQGQARWVLRHWWRITRWWLGWTLWVARGSRN